MVLGDTVNTASRLQSIAAPGTVLVDDVTRRASEAAIAYEDFGLHEVKGRDQPVHAWLGAAGRRGGRWRTPERRTRGAVRWTRSELGGDEIAAERAAHDRRAILWAVRRDGLGQVTARLGVLHVSRRDRGGPLLAPGAVPLLRRGGRLLGAGRDGPRPGRIVEEEDAAAARREAARHGRAVRDRRARAAPRGAAARTPLGLEQRTDADRADLFSGWRLFFERLSEDAPVTLAFEDLQWADSGLLDFIDYLLEWSAESPDLRDRAGAAGAPASAAPGWPPAAARPLSTSAIQTLLEGWRRVSRRSLARIGHRAEGIPLYAVETVRMLQDRGMLAQEGSPIRRVRRHLGPGGAGDAPGARGRAARQLWRPVSGRCCRTPRCSARSFTAAAVAARDRARRARGQRPARRARGQAGARA